MKIPNEVLLQIKNNQARRRGLLPLEACLYCGKPCDPSTGTIVTLYKKNPFGVTMHEECQPQDER